MNLTDQYGRKIRKLRVSLTDKCNLRCHYCMPLNQQFMDEAKYLKPQEILEVVKELTQFGLEEVRLTGGEPLMRKSFAEIADLLGTLPLRKIGLTTNGVFLDKHMDVLLKNKIHHLNISLDSLNETTFKEITFANNLKKVLENISLAVKAGFEVKINTVAMKGINDGEVLDFVEFAKDLKVEVRFLELMRIGFACNSQNGKFISAKDLINSIKLKHELRPVTSALDSTSYNFVTSHGAHIGFIASETQPFCGNCSRWRLSADGILRACLLKDEGLSIRAEKRDDIYQKLLGMKPYLRPSEVSHSMNSIGG